MQCFQEGDVWLNEFQMGNVFVGILKSYLHCRSSTEPLSFRFTACNCFGSYNIWKNNIMCFVLKEVSLLHQVYCNKYVVSNPTVVILFYFNQQNPEVHFLISNWFAETDSSELFLQIVDAIGLPGIKWTDTTYHSLGMQQRTCAL